MPEFDEAVKPKQKPKEEGTFKEIKKNEPNLETFNPPKEETSNFKDYFEGLNQKYLMDVTEIGFKDDYDLEINGVKTNFRRKKLTVNEFKTIESKQKDYNERSKSENTILEAEELAKLYFSFAELFLINSNTNQKITMDEFGNSSWEDARTIIDACLWRTIRGTSAMGK